MGRQMAKNEGIASGSASRVAAVPPLRSFDRVLFELSMSDAVTSGNLEDALQEICTTATRTLDVRSTNVWLFDAARSILSEAVTFARDHRPPCATITTESNPAYFAALQHHRVIAADDVDADPRTVDFCASYFHPRGITATLDAPVRLHGRLLGVICHEHCGGTRPWDAEEERFAASLADLVALALVADERAQAQHAVRESEARFRCLVDGMRDLIFELDPTGIITSVNRAIESMLGFAPDAWLGRHFAGIIAPEDLPIALQLFERAISRHEVPVFEIGLLHADGHFVPIEFNVSLNIDGGVVRRVFGAGRDITARRQLDTRRRAMAEIGQALARCGEDVAGALDTVREQLADALEADVVSTALCTVGTITPAAIRDHVVRRAGADDDRCVADTGASRRLIERALALPEAGGAVSIADDSRDAPGATAIAYQLRTSMGVFGAIVARHASPKPFDAEQIDLLDRVGREVALALAAARQRREAEENAALSAALARVGRDLITSVDMPVLLERLCRVTTEVLGCDTAYTFLRDDAAGSFVRAAAYGDPPQLDEALRTVPIPDRQAPGLVSALEREGVLILTASDGVVPGPFWDAYGTRISMVISLMHGSRLVGALAASNRSDARTFGPQQIRMARGIAQLASLAIANARLVGELEAAGRIKSDFVATMSHELRTPLNVILGYTDLLLLDEFGPLTPQQSDTLRRVHASAAELHELIEATLDLSRLETGSAALRIEDVDLHAWFAEVRSETAVLRERNPRVEVRFSLSGADAPVRCDALKLKVILKNLIGNALKFTTEGRVDANVSVEGAALAITVSDTGIGIEPSVQAVIFEAFRQGDPSATRPYGGVGLGLYIVRRLVDAMRGRIVLESEPGRGSEFHVEIPLDRRPASASTGRAALSIA